MDEIVNIDEIAEETRKAVEEGLHRLPNKSLERSVSPGRSPSKPSPTKMIKRNIGRNNSGEVGTTMRREFQEVLGYSPKAINQGTPTPLQIPNPIAEGFLYFENDKKKWKQKWVLLDEKNMYLFKNSTVK